MIQRLLKTSTVFTLIFASGAAGCFLAMPATVQITRAIAAQLIETVILLEIFVSELSSLSFPTARTLSLCCVPGTPDTERVKVQT